LFIYIVAFSEADFSVKMKIMDLISPKSQLHWLPFDEQFYPFYNQVIAT
jgi:hypothetical protein